MNKQEVLIALKAGKKVTHKSFTDDEWIEQKGGLYYDENGYQLSIEEFWHYRRNAFFEDGWSEFINNS